MTAKLINIWTRLARLTTKESDIEVERTNKIKEWKTKVGPLQEWLKKEETKFVQYQTSSDNYEDLTVLINQLQVTYCVSRSFAPVIFFFMVLHFVALSANAYLYRIVRPQHLYCKKYLKIFGKKQICLSSLICDPVPCFYLVTFRDGGAKRKAAQDNFTCEWRPASELFLVRGR